MDKNLKKLKRAELLELLIQASEDKEAVIAENLELRSRLRQQQQQQQQQQQANPYAGMKVGSIAEASLQANGYFEAAQRAADDYLREIKRMRDQVASRAQAAIVKDSIAAAQAVQPASAIPPVVQTQTPAQDQHSVEQAQEMASQIMHRASVQAHTMLKEAQAKSDAMVAEARQQADAALVDANRQAHAIVSRANRRAEALIAAASENASHSSPNVSRNNRQPSSTSEIKMRGRHAKRGGNEGQAA